MADIKSHVRIDDGIRKGPRKPGTSIKTRDRSIAVSGGNSIPPDLDPAQVLMRYLGDERTADIAASYNVTRPALNRWLLDHAEQDWRNAQIARAISRKERAEDELDEAADPLTLARAREKLRSAQWELERLFNRMFGQKQEITHTVLPVLTINAPVAQQDRQFIDLPDDVKQDSGG
jgi:hypothetical protein